MDYSLSYKINNTPQRFEVKSKGFYRGKHTISFDFDLLNDDEFLEHGYVVRKFPQNWTSIIKENIQAFVLSKMKSAGVMVDREYFILERYHNCVTNEQHQRVVNSFRAGMFGLGGIDLQHLGIDTNELDCFINKQVNSNKRMSCRIKKFGFEYGKFWIRIVRPNSNDNNPPHKDSHIKRISKNINLYLPIAGSNKNSSLPVIPKTHLEPESEYIVSQSPSYVNGKKNTVPCIVHRNMGLDMMCPNPKENEVMIFTPHLIHGGGVNFNKDVTRVSLEMRFFYQ